MSSLDESLGARNALRELDAFRERWKHELGKKAPESIHGESVSRPARSRRNISTIHTVPDDVLSEIFYTAAFIDPARGSLSDRHDDINGAPTGGLGWIRLTHVCRRWRILLLGLSVLWGKVAFTLPFPSAHRVLLARAESAPIDIAVVRDDFVSYWGRTVSASRPRVRLLSVLSINNRSLSTFLGQQKSMPSLRHLRLQLQYGSDRPALGGLSAHIGPNRTPSVYIDAPRLEYAYLKLNTALHSRFTETAVLRDALPTFSFNTPSLRHIEVQVFDTIARPSDSFLHNLQWLVELLRASPLLESLSLSLHLRSRTPDWNGLFESPRIQFPYLRRLTLANTSEHNLHPFLRRICTDPPPFLSVSHGKVIGDTNGAAPQERSWALNFANMYGRYLCRPGHRALTITTQREAGLLLIQSTPILNDPADFVDVWLRSQSGLSDGHPLELPELTEAVGLNIATAAHVDDMDANDAYDWLAVLASRIQAQGIQDVVQLFLRVRVEFTAAWENLFNAHLMRPMASVHTLYLLQSEPFHHVEGTMWKHTVSRMLCDMDPPLFPSLSTLLVNMEVHRSPPSVSALRDRLGDYFGHLTSVLSKRRAAGIPVCMLRILGCWPSKDIRDSVQALTIRQLERIAAVVDIVVDERVVLS